MAHSLLSPSSAKRWTACYASIGMQLKHPQTSESEYALEGTKAHELLERTIESIKAYNKELTPVDADVPEDMHKTINEAIVFLIHLMADNDLVWRNVHTEVKLKISSVDAGCYGTADIIIFDDEKNEAWVIDYKHGKGVLVESDDPQLLLYAIGVNDTYGKNFSKVHTMVLQNNHHMWKPKIKTYTQFQLNHSAKYFKAAAKKALSEVSEPKSFVPGEDQCRWCSAAPHCGAFNAKALSVLNQELMETMTIQEKLDLIPLVKQWIDKTEKFALDTAKTESIPGYKLTNSRTSRRWKYSEDQILERLSHLLPTPLFDKATQEKLLSPTQLIKLLPKGEKDYLDDLIERPVGKLTLVPDTDSRAETIDQDFADPNI